MSKQLKFEECTYEMAAMAIYGAMVGWLPIMDGRPDGKYAGEMIAVVNRLQAITILSSLVAMQNHQLEFSGTGQIQSIQVKVYLYAEKERSKILKIEFKKNRSSDVITLEDWQTKT